MPAITVEAGTLTNEQKAALGKKLTEDAAEIMKMPKETIMIFLKESSIRSREAVSCLSFSPLGMANAD